MTLSVWLTCLSPPRSATSLWFILALATMAPADVAGQCPVSSLGRGQARKLPTQKSPLALSGLGAAPTQMHLLPQDKWQDWIPKHHRQYVASARGERPLDKLCRWVRQNEPIVIKVKAALQQGRTAPGDDEEY